MTLIERLRFLLAKRSRKFEELRSTLDQSLSDGRFYRLHRTDRTYLLAKINRLQKRIGHLRWEAKIAAIGGIAALAPIEKVQAQVIGPFAPESTRAENPLRNGWVGYSNHPAVVDLDNDGDYDVVVGQGNYSNQLNILTNTGTNAAPFFEDGGPLKDYYGNLIYAGYLSFGDVDGDGDEDLVTSDYYNGLRFFLRESDGFKLQSGPSSPFYMLTVYGGTRKPIALVNFDGDADADLIVGANNSGEYEYGGSLQYFESTGGVFSSATLNTTPSLTPYFANHYFYDAAPTVADIDGDGEFDLAVGTRDGLIHFFKGNAGTFTEQTGAWDSGTKAGNPFNDITFDRRAVPTFVDLDNDGDQDMIVGYEPNYGPSGIPLAYFENTGQGVFVQKIGFDSPFGGVNVHDDGTPYFVDIDGDGQIDALLGGKYDKSIVYYKNDNNKFTEVPDGQNPFIDLSFKQYAGAKPVYVDLDDDGDMDLVTGNFYGELIFFKNVGGVLEKQVMDSNNPFISLGSLAGYYYASHTYYGVRLSSRNSAIDMVDIDNDGDLDLFSGNDYGTIQFFENTGTAQAPYFEVPADPASNPLDKSHITQFYDGSFNYSYTNPRFVDIDNDGDFDMLMGSYYRSTLNENGVYFFENTGTPEAAVFEMHPGSLITNVDYNPNPGLIDMDSDGDLDLFIGNYYGTFKYYKNTNPAPVSTPSITQIDYNFGDGSVVVDASFVLDDTDADFIQKATFTIQNFLPGQEELVFATMGSISGTFDAVAGVLTLTGQGTVAEYQAAIRTITYNYIGTKAGAGGRTNAGSGKQIVLAKTIDISVFDQDLTTPQVASISLGVTFANVVPVLTTSASPVTYTGTPIAIDGTISVTDGDDADLASASIQITPSSFQTGDLLSFTDQNGITGSYNAGTGLLDLTGVSSVANYQAALRSVKFESSEISPVKTDRSIEFVVNDGEGNSNVIANSVAINVNNPPVLTLSAIATVIQGKVNLDLTTVISDPDGNLDPASFKIKTGPVSNATTTITNSILTIDYTNTYFAGTDQMTIEACDLDGACAQADLTVNVEGDIVVFEGISPNGDGLNDTWQIANIVTLEPENRVTIYTRWGDEVFSVDDYDNVERVFTGQNKNGHDLSSGVYFYKIAFGSGRKDLTGYLTIKR